MNKEEIDLKSKLSFNALMTCLTQIKKHALYGFNNLKTYG